MNRNFKVVFSKARGALMVVNEATSSVQAKGTKTVIAAAVAALSLGAGVASAADSQTFTEVTLGAGDVLTVTTETDANKYAVTGEIKGSVDGRTKPRPLRRMIRSVLMPRSSSTAASSFCRIRRRLMSPLLLDRLATS